MAFDNANAHPSGENSQASGQVNFKASYGGSEQPSAVMLSVPHSFEAEQALLGALLISPHLLDKVSPVVSSQDFYAPLHSEIYAAMSSLLESGKAIVALTLEPLLRGSEKFGEAGGLDYLAYLASSAPAVSSAYNLAQLIVEYATRRRLIEIGEAIVLDARNTATDLSPNQQIEEAERRLYSIAETKRFGGGFTDFGDATSKALHMAEQAFKRPGGLSGLSTGFIDIDKVLGGLQPSDLIILAGRPSMGKTALATDIAVAVSRQAARAHAEGDAELMKTYCGGVGFFSLEMSAEQLATRVISSQARIPSSQIRRGTISEREFDNVIQTGRELDTMPLYIDETGALTVGQLAARARRLKRQHGLSLIVIDYVQLLRGSRTKAGDSRTQEVTEITTSLKALAKELNVPIIAAAQLSRQVENREGNRPQLSDLRESGSIEQDADVVMFVYRREYYLEREKPSDDDSDAIANWQKEMGKSHGKAEVIVGKQRHGPTGTIHLAFKGEYTRFDNYAAQPDERSGPVVISHDIS